MVASSQAPTGPEYEQRFLTILNNESKDRSPPTDIPGAGGFVVVVRGGSSLKPLQDLCLDPERQTYNTCFTARYRLQPKMAVGTLLASWLIDVTKMARGQKDLAGDLRVGRDSELESLIAKLSDHPPVTASTGALTSDFLKSIVDYISTQGVVHRGQRVVLFAELGEEATDQEEWRAGTDKFVRRLTGRVGIVVFGAPQDFRFP